MNTALKCPTRMLRCRQFGGITKARWAAEKAIEVSAEAAEMVLNPTEGIVQTCAQ